MTSVVTQYNLPSNAPQDANLPDEHSRSFKTGYHSPTLFFDAIKDLPAFEFQVPNEAIDRKREKYGPVPSSIGGHFLGFPGGITYKSEPQTNFQRLMRS